MSKEEVLERALRSYMAYYDVERETPEEHIAAEAALQNPRPSARQNPTNMYFLPLQTAWTRNFSGNWTMPPGKKAWRG